MEPDETDVPSMVSSSSAGTEGYQSLGEDLSDHLNFSGVSLNSSTTIDDIKEKIKGKPDGFRRSDSNVSSSSLLDSTLKLEDDFDTDAKDLFVSVENPEKHTTAMESYITFKVSTKTTRSEYNSSEYSVRRRYNDFLWLRQKLEVTNPSHLVPPLPEKHPIRKLDRFDPQFIRTREVALQKFVKRLADHPVLSFSKHFQMFLTLKHYEFQAHKKQGAGIISRFTDSIHNMSAAYMIKNRSPEYTMMNEYIHTFGDKLGTIDRISLRILKEQTEFLNLMKELGPMFTLWQGSEDQLAGGLAGLATAVDKCCDAMQEMISATDKQFSQPLREYLLYTEAIKSVLRRRDAIQMEYELTLDELNKKKDEREHLTSQVEALNDRSTCANADLKADMERWHKTKRRDFKKLFVGAADRQIRYFQKCLSAWEEAIPAIHKTDQMDEVPLQD
ncbi:sorting nexin-30-like isoform X2 [Lineus longissimus]|uniref:sorting nexin-30-like isoform X2 n=1 Tax=Lineus longissimus TaxID=88925 RepID=UPI002B4E5EE2